MTDDPVQRDERIKKGVVLSTERGQLYVAQGRYYRKCDGTSNGWYGMGFNGERVKADVPEFVASTINAYITSTYGSED